MLNIIKTSLVVLSLMTSATVIGKEQTYVREYTYQASEIDSKVSARKTSLLLLKEKLLSEIGTYVDSSVNIFSSSTGVKVSSHQIQSLTEGFIKTEIMQESWNGVTFVIKAKLQADPDAIAEKLKAIINANKPKTESSEEFEYWKSVVKIDSSEAYVAYMSKYPKGKYQELAQIAILRIKKDLEMQDANKRWLVKRNSDVVLVVRHDVGTASELDSDVITRELGTSARKLIQNYVSKNSKVHIISDFDSSDHFRFNHKKQSIKVCQKNNIDLVSGVMLEDHEGSGGMHRPVRLFIYDCEKQFFKITSFVPTGSSAKDFWRDNSIRKNMRIFIQDYMDEV